MKFKVGDEIEITEEWPIQRGAICKIVFIDKNPYTQTSYYKSGGRDGCKYTLRIIKPSSASMQVGSLFCGSSCMRLLNKPFEGDIEFNVEI